jgi:periplasmic protein CpxP/Spy
VSLSKAQGRQQRSPAEQAKNLQTQLSLTDDQTAKITAIYTAQAAKRDSLMKAANGDMQAMRGQMRPMMQATTEKIKAVLTDDQKKAYDKMQAERMQRMQNGGGQGGGGTPPPSQN